MNKTVCIYHSVDLDGWMSAAIVKHWFEEAYELNSELDFIGYNYGNPIPDLSQYGRVIMCDVSFPDTHMLNLAIRVGVNFIWIDHHQRKVDEVSKYLVENKAPTIDGLVTNEGEKIAACELTWDFLFNDRVTPEIVRLLGMYDSFRHKDTDESQKVLEFQYSARSTISNYKEAYKALINLSSSGIHSMLQMGKAIYQYLCTDAIQIYENRFTIYFGEYAFCAINKERFNPINFGIEYHNDKADSVYYYDGVACFHFDGELWNFSLYNGNGNVDCSTIAKTFGGGGHAGASGFRLTNEEFNNFMNVKLK